jgi:hypothetical protein
MRIRWTVPAADDLENIKNYLQRHYPHFAEPTVPCAPFLAFCARSGVFSGTSPAESRPRNGRGQVRPSGAI